MTQRIASDAVSVPEPQGAPEAPRAPTLAEEVPPEVSTASPTTQAPPTGMQSVPSEAAAAPEAQADTEGTRAPAAAAPTHATEPVVPPEDESAPQSASLARKPALPSASVPRPATPTQLSLELPAPPATEDTPLVPVRMVNEWIYCPRLAFLEWVDGEWADSGDTEEGRRVHVRVDAGGGRLPPADETGGSPTSRPAR
jgi:hypothetical protein